MYCYDGDGRHIICRDGRDDPYSDSAGHLPENFRFGSFTLPFLDFPDECFDFSVFSL